MSTGLLILLFSVLLFAFVTTKLDEINIVFKSGLTVLGPYLFGLTISFVILSSASNFSLMQLYNPRDLMTVCVQFIGAIVLFYVLQRSNIVSPSWLFQSAVGCAILFLLVPYIVSMYL